MDKIKELLKAMGGSEQLSTELVSLMENHIKTTISNEKAKLTQEFDVKLSKVKQVCVEEVEAEKVRLARGVQHFITAQIDKIKKAGAKQLANEANESVNKLKTIKALVEGINVDEAKASKELQATLKENKALREQIAESKSQVAQLNAKVAKYHGVAEKSLQRQAALETQLNEAKKVAVQPVVKEDKKPQTAVTESVASPKEDKKAIAEERVVKGEAKTTVAKSPDVKPESEDTLISQIAASL